MQTLGCSPSRDTTDAPESLALGSRVLLDRAFDDRPDLERLASKPHRAEQISPFAHEAIAHDPLHGATEDRDVRPELGA
jgi:hypothetical protein